MPIRRLNQNDMREISLAEHEVSIAYKGNLRKKLQGGKLNLHKNIYEIDLNSNKSTATIERIESLQHPGNLSQFEKFGNSNCDYKETHNSILKPTSNDDTLQLHKTLLRKQNRSLRISPVRRALSVNSPELSFFKSDIASPQFTNVRKVSTSRIRFKEPDTIFQNSTPFTTQKLKDIKNKSSQKKRLSVQLRIKELKQEIDHNIELYNESMSEQFDNSSFFNETASKQPNSYMHDPNKFPMKTMQCTGPVDIFPSKKTFIRGNERNLLDIGKGRKHLAYMNDDKYSFANNSVSKSSIDTFHSLSPSIQSSSRHKSFAETSNNTDTSNDHIANTTVIYTEYIKYPDHEIQFTLSSNMIKMFCDEEGMWKNTAKKWLIDDNEPPIQKENVSLISKKLDTSHMYKIRTMVMNSLSQ